MGLLGSGAQDRVDIYGIKDDHSGIVKVDRTTAATSLATDPLVTLGNDLSGDFMNTSVDVTYDDAGIPTIKIVTTQYDAAVKLFKETYCPKKVQTTSSSVGEKTSVSGRKIGGSTSGSSQLPTFVILYGHKTGVSVIMNSYVVQWKLSSLGKSYKGGEYTEYTFEGTAIAAKAAIVIAVGLQDSTLVVPTSSTQAINTYEGEFLLAKGTLIT